MCVFRLLIVPYGIETVSITAKETAGTLLIVPYGIETILSAFFINNLLTFNRTLWN